MTEPIRVAVFDIIETVFSLAPVRRAIAGCGLDGRDLETWFAFGLRDAFALDTTHHARPFPDILREALEELLAIRGGRGWRGRQEICSRGVWRDARA